MKKEIIEFAWSSSNKLIQQAMSDCLAIIKTSSEDLQKKKENGEKLEINSYQVAALSSYLAISAVNLIEMLLTFPDISQEVALDTFDEAAQLAADGKFKLVLAEGK